MSRTSKAFGLAWVFSVEILGLVAQLTMIVVGYNFMMIDDDEPYDEIGRLLAWCVIGTLYVIAVMVWLNIDLRIRDSDHPMLRKITSGILVRWLSTVFTFSASIVGLTAAVTLILLRSDPSHLAIYELVAVWAMLVAWAIFHWGYARIYFSKYYRAKDNVIPLKFPGTTEPRLLDFVYFSFTIGTSFAPSDVTVTSTRMRWTVVWHTVFSFFFNALIIVLTMNTISGGLQGQ